jgi:hypothetical protein
LIEEEGLNHYDGLLHDLHELLDPSAEARPIQPLRLQHVSSGAVAELHFNPDTGKGNYMLKHAAFEGVGMRPLSASETSERIGLLIQRCEEIGVLTRELSLVRNSDRPAAAKILKLAGIAAKRGEAFARRCTENPLAIYAVAVVNQESGQREYMDSKGLRHASVNGTPMPYKVARRLAERAGGDVIDTSQRTLEEIVEDAARLRMLFTADD